jgi:hypothetical protein
MSVGWLDDLAEAETYYEDERLETAAWDALIITSGGKDEKTAVLKMAYNRIRRCRDFEIPASPDATQLALLKEAQLETAYYLALHLADEDRRKGIQAQAVTAAGVVKEGYAESRLSKVPLPPVVYEILDAFAKYDTPFFAVDIDRDEDYSVDEDVTDLL